MKEYFDEVSNKWDKMRTYFFSDNVRDKATENIGGNQKVVDLGAGTGFITEKLIKKEAHIIAVDNSQNMLNVLVEKYADYDNLEVICTEGTNIPIPDNSVDFVVANMYLHHVEDPLEAIKEATRILKVKGKIIITDLEKHNFDFLRKEHFDKWLGFEYQDIEAWFKKCMLSDISIQSIDEKCNATSQCGCNKASVGIFMAIATKSN